jgi:hypothetical protein
MSNDLVLKDSVSDYAKASESKNMAAIIGASRYKCYGMSGSHKVVLYNNTVTPFKRKNEIESAVWSQIASQSVAGKLLSKG